MRWRWGAVGVVVCATALSVTLGGCSSAPPTPAPTPTLVAPQADRDRLAGLAAAAQGRAYVATYQLVTPNRGERSVTVAVGTDGSWLVAIPGSGFSGLADLAMFQSSAGEFQCLLRLAPGTASSRPDLAAVAPGCVKVDNLTPATDPRVQHVFTDWLPALTDRSTALAVSAIPNPSGATGACFSVESTSAALTPPVDPGSYCFTPDGVLTAASVGFGQLRLAGAVAAAPPSVAMPGPVVNRPLVPVLAPAAPKPSGTPSGSPSARA